MDQNNVQVLFFKQIKELLPANISVVDDIAEVLQISTDSAYRRIRGEKPISFEDLQKLSAKYRISVDQLLHNKNNAFIFTGKLGFASSDFVEQYLNSMLQQFDYMRGNDNIHIYFLPGDIPPFEYLQFPELAAFTFFYYKKSLLFFDEMKDKKFSVKDLNKEHVKLGKKVQASYNLIPSSEIWGTDIINSILRHISFYRDTAAFESPDDILCIYNSLEELVNHIEKQAELGLKFNYGEEPDKNTASYQMYYNDLISGDNCVLAQIEDMKITYINHNLINFMFTRDVEFNNYTFDTFKNAVRKSTQISQVGEKARARFFDTLRKQIRFHRQAINHHG